MGANWSLWADIPHTELWRAIALSLDIEPSELPGYDRSAVRDPIFSYPFSRCPPVFLRRLEIAIKHLGRNLKPISFAFTDWNSEVDLQELRLWATSLNSPWDFPEHFPSIKSASYVSGKSSEPSNTNLMPNVASIQSPTPMVQVHEHQAKNLRGEKQWIPKAQEYAKQFIEKQAAVGATPNQNVIGDHVAKRFRDEGVKTQTGKPPTGSYIKRYALKGLHKQKPINL